MRPEREYVPLFGCRPHTPDRAYPELARLVRSRKKISATCPTCDGVQPEGSPFVCMGCHGVAPEVQEYLDKAQAEAEKSGEPSRNLVRRAITDKLESTGRSILKAEERALLVAEHGETARKWLDSIGQPAAVEVAA